MRYNFTAAASPTVALVCLLVYAASWSSLRSGRRVFREGRREREKGHGKYFAL